MGNCSRSIRRPSSHPSSWRPAHGPKAPAIPSPAPTGNGASPHRIRWSGIDRPHRPSECFRSPTGRFKKRNAIVSTTMSSSNRGPWNNFNSCWFNSLYSRVIPGHAMEMTSALLDRYVTRLAGDRGPHSSRNRSWPPSFISRRRSRPWVGVIRNYRSDPAPAVWRPRSPQLPTQNFGVKAAIRVVQGTVRTTCLSATVLGITRCKGPREVSTSRRISRD